MTTTPPPGPTRTPIDPKLGAAAPRAPAASREDSRPQAILKLQPRNSFDYRVCYAPQLFTALYFDSKTLHILEECAKADIVYFS